MDDYPAKIADLLENVATRVRSTTVDRVAGWARWAAAGVVLAVIVLLVFIFLLVGVFRLLGELIGVEAAYAAFGGLFVIVGLFLWSKRKPQPATEE